MELVNVVSRVRGYLDPNEIEVYDDHCKMVMYLGRTVYRYKERALFDIDLLDKVVDRKWHISMYGYAASHQSSLGDTGPLFMHHLVLPQKPGLYTDHEDENKLNNRKSNLRYATPAQNQQNKNLCYGRIPIKGVSYDPTSRSCNKYRCYVEADNVRYWGPRCSTVDEAEYWVRNKREQLHGQFANHGN